MELGVHIFFHSFKPKTEEYTLMSDIQTMGQTSYFSLCSAHILLPA